MVVVKFVYVSYLNANPPVGWLWHAAEELTSRFGVPPDGRVYRHRPDPDYPDEVLPGVLAGRPLVALFRWPGDGCVWSQLTARFEWSRLRNLK